MKIKNIGMVPKPAESTKRSTRKKTITKRDERLVNDFTNRFLKFVSYTGAGSASLVNPEALIEQYGYWKDANKRQILKEVVSEYIQKGFLGGYPIHAKEAVEVVCKIIMTNPRLTDSIRKKVEQELAKIQSL